MRSVKGKFVTPISLALLVSAIVLLVSCGKTAENKENQSVVEKEQMNTPICQTSFTPSQPLPDFVQAAESSVNAVVHIKTKVTQSNTYDDFFGALLGQLYGYQGQPYGNTKTAYGSGVVLSPDGYIVTNNHVVDGADEIEVTFNNKVTKSATIVGADPSSDLALIKVDAKDCDFLAFGDSDKVHIGEWVLAVGNPFNLTSTVTAGIVSAKARNIGILGEGSSVESFIQTDAAINPGNSGGALVNTRGELIGINAAIASHTGSYEGYSFAIPSNIVRKVVDDLLMYGETQKAYIGVSIADVTSEFAEKKGLSSTEGVYVSEVVKNGGADMAGIRSGDVIVAINGNKVNTSTQVFEVVGQYRPGDKVDVEVVRNNTTQIFSVTLLNRSGSQTMSKRSESFYSEDLGLVLRPVSQGDKSSLKIGNGLKIVEIRKGRFQGVGISKGFVITVVNGVNVSSESDLNNALSKGRSRMTRIEGISPNGMKQYFEYYD